MALGFRSLLDSAKKLAINGPGSKPTPLETIFPKTDPAVDGDECLHDCDSCTIKYPRNFKVELDDNLYGAVRGWSTHMLVATGKTDWVRDIADEKGSVMEAVNKVAAPSNGRLMLSASNIPTPHHSSDYADPTRVLLLPAFVVVDNVTPAQVPALIHFVSQATTNQSRLAAGDEPGATAPPDPPLLPSIAAPLSVSPSPHNVLVLLCSQKTRDARCGQSAPLIRRELERHLRPLGLYRDLNDERPGGVGIYFISHVGGHKYSANVIIYRRPNPFGLDDVQRGTLTAAERDALPDRVRAAVRAWQEQRKGVNETNGTNGTNGTSENEKNRKNEKNETSETNETTPPAIDAGAAQGLWLARVRPDDCENLVRYTILQGKLVKPESQLRAGFDRSRGVLSW